jgi:hypothetical protein
LFFLEDANDPKKYCETATIVADPRTFDDRPDPTCPNISALTKNGIEVGAEDQVRPCGHPRPLREHIAGAIDSDVLQSE